MNAREDSGDRREREQGISFLSTHTWKTGLALLKSQHSPPPNRVVRSKEKEENTQGERKVMGKRSESRSHFSSTVDFDDFRP